MLLQVQGRGAVAEPGFGEPRSRSGQRALGKESRHFEQSGNCGNSGKIWEGLGKVCDI